MKGVRGEKRVILLQRDDSTCGLTRQMSSSLPSRPKGSRPSVGGRPSLPFHTSLHPRPVSSLPPWVSSGDSPPRPPYSPCLLLFSPAKGARRTQWTKGEPSGNNASHSHVRRMSRNVLKLPFRKSPGGRLQGKGDSELYLSSGSKEK
jgi:hypothetical protein